MKVEQIYAAEAELLRQGLNEWADEGRLSAERSDALATIVRSTAPNKPILGPRRLVRLAVAAAAAVAALLFLASFLPPALAWATETFPAIAAYLGLKAQEEPGWQWALEHEALQEVLAQVEDQGYTFRVHRVLADPSQTAFVYSIEGPDPQAPDFTAGETGGIWFNGQSFVTHNDGEGNLLDGLYVGVEEVNPLPAERGTLTIDLQAIGEVRGRWVVDFPVTREALTLVSRTIPVQQLLGPLNLGLQVHEVVVLPTQTEVRLRWEGPRPMPSISAEAVEVRTQSGQMVPSHLDVKGYGQGTSDSDMSYEYRIQYDPLPAGTKAIKVYLRGVQAVTPGERLSVRLEEGATGELGGLPPATVRSVASGLVTVQWAHDRENPFPYEDWRVVDDLGEVHDASWTMRETDGGAIMTATVTWDDLPTGRSPVALEARWVWRQYQGDWQVEIPIE